MKMFVIFTRRQQETLFHVFYKVKDILAEHTLLFPQADTLCLIRALCHIMYRVAPLLITFFFLEALILHFHRIWNHK